MSVSAFAPPPHDPGLLVDAFAAMPAGVAYEAMWQVLAAGDEFRATGDRAKLDLAMDLFLAYGRASKDPAFHDMLRRAREDHPRTPPTPDEEIRIRDLLGA